MSPGDYIVVIVLIIAVAGSFTTIFLSFVEYQEKIAMLKRGFVPKGYQPLPRNDAAQSPTKSESDQPAALPPAPWSAQQWQEGVPTSRYIGELAKDSDTRR